MKRIRKAGYALLGVALLAAGAAWVAAENPDARLGRNMEILMNLLRETDMFYVDKVDTDKLLKDAAEGMLGDLDPYTEFLPESEMSDFEFMTTGKYGGIGSLIRQKGDETYIAQPYEGFPADKAGLRIGDRIVAVNGERIKGYPSARVSAMLKGDPGTPVKVTVERIATGAEEEVTIRRERIVISGVAYAGFVDDSIGYIHLSDFTEDCSSDVRRALMDLKATGRLKGLVFDLRGNGGGILQEAVKIVSLFVPKGTEVVSMRGKFKEMDATFRTEGEPVAPALPLVVLTNSGSASAAEIVSGALQDLDRAVLLGQRTFGKGLVQSTRPLGYNAYLKVTTAKYYMPSGRCIQAIDYTHRNEDGSVGAVPDSLIREYRTAGGRKVYDGGGIMPDSVMAPEYASRFALVLYAKGYIEDFGDQYYKTHPEPVDIATFEVTDSLYNAFAAFMRDKDMTFESGTAAALRSLREKAERERYLDRIAGELDAIEASLREDTESELQTFRDEIADLIAGDIILRYHYARGVSQYKLMTDREVQAAAGLLAAPELYREILESRDTARK
ncbi:MAG: S41 family peptidase [Rikenellaceae bacterium]|nr:S41 family peptidase [Rikenellaceae bacterium]